MPHCRHDYPSAIHLLRVQGRRGDNIFFSPTTLRAKEARTRMPELRFWESLVVRACDRHAARIHGYVWLPNEALLLVQRFAVPLRIILPSLLGRYSRYLHKLGRVPRGESPYECRCESIEVTRELLPYAVRHLYARPVNAGLCASPLEYALSSLDLHFADRGPGWFDTSIFLDGVRKRGHSGHASVQQFLAKPETRRHAELFERFSSRTPTIAGERFDIDEALQLATASSQVPSVEEVAAAVAAILRKESRFGDRVLSLALTTWYATRTGAATLAQMGRWFEREPTTLRADIESRRRLSAPLFELTSEELLEQIRAANAVSVSVPAGLTPHSVTRAQPPHEAVRRGEPNRGGCSRSGLVRAAGQLSAACRISLDESPYDDDAQADLHEVTRRRRPQ
jgi:hypothetical protein